jgi:hypothetical protein
MTLILNAQYQFISKGGYSRNTLAAVTKTRCVTVHGGSVSPASRAQGERQRVVAVAVHVVGDRAKHDAAAIVGVDLLLLAGAAMNVGSSPWLNDDAVALPPVHFDGILGVDGSLRRVTLTGGPVADIRKTSVDASASTWWRAKRCAEEVVEKGEGGAVSAPRLPDNTG